MSAWLGRGVFCVRVATKADHLARVLWKVTGELALMGVKRRADDAHLTWVTKLTSGHHPRGTTETGAKVSEGRAVGERRTCMPDVNSRKAKNGKCDVVTSAAVLPRGFSSLGRTSEPFEDKVCGPRAARHARPSSLTSPPSSGSQAWQGKVRGIEVNALAAHDRG